MKITIPYESSWHNSFLEGSNNEPIPKNGRKYKATSKNFKYDEQPITINTIMGLLNRLIGDRRKLYQSRECPKYYFKTLEHLISFENKDQVFSREVVFLTNTNRSSDPNAESAVSKLHAFTADFSTELWGVLNLSPDQVCEFILNDNYTVLTTTCKSPQHVIDTFGSIKGKVPDTKTGMEAFQWLHDNGFLDESDTKTDVDIKRFYCSAITIQLRRLCPKYDMTLVTTTTTKNRDIFERKLGGISYRNFTKQEFKKYHSEPMRIKHVRGGPYQHKDNKLIKSSGNLEIELDISKAQALELHNMIIDAGVATFRVGKKGLGYVHSILI